MRFARAFAAVMFMLFASMAAWGEFTAVAAVAETRWPALVMAGIAALLFAIHLRGAKRGAGRAFAVAGAVASLGIALFAIKLLFFTYREVPVRFSDRDVTFAGTLYEPRSTGPFPAIVFIHGSGKSTRSNFAYHAKLFARHGFAALAYDKRGSGESGGDTWDGPYELYAHDAAAAIRFLKSRPEIEPHHIGVEGQSQGGWVAPLVAQEVPDLAFVIVTSSTPLPPAEQVVYETGAEVRRAGFPEAVVQRALDLQSRVMDYHRTGAGKDSLLADLKAAANEPWFGPAELPAELYPLDDYAWWRSVMDFDAVAAWREVSCPVLAINGGRDTKSDAQASIEGIRRALAAGGDTDFTGRIFPNMEHGNIEWWLPGHLPPPRFPAGYSKLLVSWAQAQVGATRTP